MQELIESSDVHTFLIADIRGYTRYTVEHGDEAGARLASRFAALADATVARQGGRVIELRGDEALAVFRSPRHALRAGVELQLRFQQESAADPSQPMPVGIGLDAGEAVPIGGGFRGAALNCAARLCSLAAAGEVLATEELVHLARRMAEVEYAERGAVELKGFQEPVRVIEVRPTVSSPSAVPPASTPLPDASQPNEPIPAVTIAPMGPEASATSGGSHRMSIGGSLGMLPAATLVARTDELQRALFSLGTAAAGRGQLVLLAGEPGVGKTRLAQEVTLLARNQGFLIAAGRCYEHTAAVPYYPFMSLLERVYAEAPVAVRRVAPIQWPYLAHFLPDFSGAAPPSGAPDEQQEVFRSVAGFVRAVAAERPVALLIDDLHWADGASLQLLQTLADETRDDRVFMLATYRNADADFAATPAWSVSDLSRNGNAAHIPLAPLGQEETADLMAAAIGQDEISPELAAMVHGRTDGNPFFTRQVMRSLVDGGQVYRENGGWRSLPSEDVPIPDTVHAAIGERVARLSPGARAVLSEASTFGQTFDRNVLRALSGRDAAEVEAALAEASAAGLIREVGDNQYAFEHALTRGALYHGIPAADRQRLHLAAGEALERAGPASTRVAHRTVHAAQLAHHFHAAGAHERSVPYALEAGHGAESMAAPAEAEQHYRTALDMAQELERMEHEAQSLEHLARVLERRGQALEARRAAESALEGYRAADDPEAEERMAQQLRRLGDPSLP